MNLKREINGLDSILKLLKLGLEMGCRIKKKSLILLKNKYLSTNYQKLA
jgi:hypothetical protein